MTSRGGHLIFLVSQPRAGSTLLQRVIGSHSRVHTAPEPWLALHPLFALKADATAAPGDTALADRATREFLARIPRGETIYLDGVRHLLGSVYDAALAASGKSVFLDKTPRYYQILPELRRVFPDAHVVILLRNPIAVLSSMLETWIDEDGGDGLHLLKEDLLDALSCSAELDRPDGRLSKWLDWASRSRLAPFVKLGRTLREHLAGIRAFLEHRVTNGLAEGVNNKIRLLSHRAFGFHSAAPLIATIYLCCGGITLPELHLL